MQAKPGYDDVMRCVEAVARDNPRVKADSVGKSRQGRAIPLVEITDPHADEADKQVVLLTAGTHGTEEAGRLVCIGLMEYLASAQPRVTLRNQKFVILPCVNPDGSVANVPTNADKANLYESFGGPGRPTAHEAGLIWDAVGSLNPALAVDIHGLAGGAMNEEFYFHPAFANSPVNFLGPVLAEEARAAAEAAGYPQKEVRRVDARCLPARLAAECNCFAYTEETTENFYPAPQMLASGLVRLKGLIAVGDRRNYFHYYSGYPCEAVSGHAMGWLCAHGRTAAARGQNRRQLLANIAHVPMLRRAYADAGGAAALLLAADADLPALPRFSLQLRVHKPARIRCVCFDGQELSPEEEDGFVTWEDAASHVVRVNVNRPLTKGEHSASVGYDVRW